MKRKKIGIIGAGLVGTALTKQLIHAGHDVQVANSRGPSTLQSFEKETGAKAVDLGGVVSDVDILILAVPLKNIPGLRPSLNNLPQNVVVLDVCNYYPWRDGQISEINEGMAESVWVSHQLTRPVIKAFNNIIASNIVDNSKPKDTQDRVALPVSGDDPSAKNTIIKLVEEVGFTAYDAGSLADSWRQQPGEPVYCTNPTLKELPSLLARANRKTAAGNRSKIKIILAKIPQDFSGQYLTSVSRLFIGLDIFKLKSWTALIRLGWAML